jgi:hypothetical protein
LVEIRFNAAKSGEATPQIALYLLGSNGRIERKLTVAEKGKLMVPKEVLAKGGVFALGPDVSDPPGLPKEQMVLFRADQVSTWVKEGHIDIPKALWPGWLRFYVCVSGKVEKCFPIYLGHLPLKSKVRYFPHICAPICNGVVEVYQTECCCRSRIIDIDLSELLRRLREAVLQYPPIHIPGPGPVESTFIEGVANPPTASPAAARLADSVRLSRAMGNGTPLVNMNVDLQTEVAKVESMPKQEALLYIQQNEYLWPFICSCSTVKLGEAILQPDGHFSFCFFRFPVPANCSFRYSYKVKQWNGTSWTYIYDGLASHASFPDDVVADIKTFLGKTCDPGPGVPTGDLPYVMLEDVGSTPSYLMVSQTQASETTLGAVADNGGLVNPPSGSDVGQLTNQPWGATLSFRLRFHDGMQALGAQYYRVSIIPTNDGSNPSGAPQILTNSIAWSQFVFVSGHIQVQSVGLGPVNPGTVGGQVGLYKIPFGTDWLWPQYHNYWSTTAEPNGRYMMEVEVFDAAGNRLKPTGTPGSGTDAAFNFLRWTDSVNTTPVPFPDLLHLFWVDNVPCYAKIVDLRMNGVANTAECQFMTGDCCSTFSAGYRAFHSTRNSISQPETFMWSYEIWYHRGLGGPTVVTDTGGLNQPSTLGGGSPAVSSPQTFASMLSANCLPKPVVVQGQCGQEPTEHKKCSFALNVYVWAKHTDGSRRLSEYDASDQAAFALEL